MALNETSVVKRGKKGGKPSPQAKKSEAKTSKFEKKKGKPITGPISKGLKNKEIQMKTIKDDNMDKKEKNKQFKMKKISGIHVKPAVEPMSVDEAKLTPKSGLKRKMEDNVNPEGKKAKKQKKKKVRFSDVPQFQDQEVMNKETDEKTGATKGSKKINKKEEKDHVKAFVAKEEEEEEDDNEENSDEGDEDVEDEDVEDDDNIIGKEFNLDDITRKNPVTVKADQPGREKTSSKEAHIKQKQQTLERKMKNNKHYDLSTKAKQIWEEARREDCPKEKRTALLESLTNLTKGHVKEIIRAHDTVRVIQCIVALGNDKHRTMLFEELKDSILELTKSKYSKFFVMKMLKYGTRDQKATIIKSFFGKVTKLLRHKEAAIVVEFAYNEVANAKQRALLVQEFYGQEFALFKDDNTYTLEQVLEKAADSQKKVILENLTNHMVKITEKTIFRHSITHLLFRELFKFGDEDIRTQLVDALKEVVVEMVHTKDGARVAMECLWHGGAKERKIIVKSFKKYVSKIAEEDHGYLVLIAALDAVDDTKLLEKTIISELVSCGSALATAKSKNGVKVFEYILSPRDPKFFDKNIVAILEAGDSNPHSKKERPTRERELREAASPHLFQMVIDHIKELTTNGSTCLLVFNILTNALVNDEPSAALLEAALGALVKLVTQEGIYHEAKEEANMHPIEKGQTSFLLKKLIKFDENENKKKNANKTDSNQSTVRGRFSSVLINTVSKEVLRSYVGCNKGCFLLLNLIETDIPEIVSKVTSALTGINRTLASKNYKGASLLLEKLKSISKQE